ncbi:DUF6049 family protein [Propionibacteriaceae bacterium G1746]
MSAPRAAPPPGGRPRRAAARLRHLVLLATATALALLGMVSSPGPQARAAEGIVTIELTSVTPDTLSAGGTVTIKGKVTNTSGKSMRQVQVSFWRSTDAVTTEADFRLLLSSPWDVPIGARMGGQGTDPTRNLFNITDDARPTFEAGATAEFTVSASVDQLGLAYPQPGTLYLLGVHVRAIPADDVNQTVGRSRVFMPYAPEKATVAPVVLLTSAPAMAVDGSLVDDHIAGELTGRLHTLLRAAALPGATVLIDPGLYDELRAMSDGYSFQGNQVAADDPRAVAARQWLSDFEAISNTKYRVPYGDPDLVAAAAAQRLEVVDRAQKALTGEHPLAALPVAVWPTDNHPSTAASRAFMAPLGVDLWVQPSSTTDLTTLTDGSTRLLYDRTITTGGPGPAPQNTLPQRQGRLLSQLVVSRRPTVLPVRTAAEAAVVMNLPGWVTTVGLADMPSSTQAVPDADPAPISGAPNWDAIVRTQRRLEAWYDLAGQTSDGVVPIAQVTSRSANPLLGQHAGRYLTEATAAATPLSASGLSIQMANTFVLGDTSGTLPVTVINNSDRPVLVKVRMTSDNAQRISIPDTALVRVPARSSASVQFTPQARSNGVVGFTAQLVTEQGRTVGAPRRFSVNATNFGRVGWIIIITSGAVVLGGTAVRIKQVQRERARQQVERAAAAKVATGPATPRQDTSSRPHP